MADTDFSLNKRDHQRLWKDRVVRIAVTCGGVGVLGALVLMFVYFAMVVTPLFSGAKFQANQATVTIPVNHVNAMAVDDYGQALFTFSQDGEAQFWSLTQPEQSAMFSQKVAEKNALIANMPIDYGWFATLDANHHFTLLKPKFSYKITSAGRDLKPELITHHYTFNDINAVARVFTFSVNEGDVSLATYRNDGSLTIYWGALDEAKLSYHYRFPIVLDNVDQLLFTPDGQTLYIRDRNELVVAERKGNKFVVRELVDLGGSQQGALVTDIKLLAGAYSLLVSYNNDQVSQWFDVLKDGQRRLQQIRTFHLAKATRFLLPDTYRKGFYSFHDQGVVQNHFTTSEKTVLTKHIESLSPLLATMSNNERYIVTWDGKVASLAKISNDYPEVSFSALWQKVWYEHYPEPQFVWQSTSASDKFEAKFSLVPIAFGTLKAATYAMLFAVPIAVFGAIYTAYFMTPKLRRVVKPTIELMEALPTVIIGFLAGLWLAPLVESHLTAVMCLLVILPLSTIIAGLIWTLLPNDWKRFIPNGLHVVILMPVLVMVTWLMMSNSQLIESALFNGDVRVFLVQHGIDFDQRNALVVGLAMGFAVIPTIFTIAEDAIFSVPKHLSDGSLALGATPWQTLTRVVLLTASPGIFSAIMMGLGRAVGETMIVLMATGNTPILDWNIFEGMRTLSATIAVELPEAAVGSSHFRILFLAALILFAFTFVVNSIAEWVRQRLREKYRSL